MQNKGRKDNLCLFESYVLYMPCHLIFPETLVITCCDRPKAKKTGFEHHSVYKQKSRKSELGKLKTLNLQLPIMCLSSSFVSEPCGGQVCVSCFKVTSPLSRPYKTRKWTNISKGFNVRYSLRSSIMEANVITEGYTQRLYCCYWCTDSRDKRSFLKIALIFHCLNGHLTSSAGRLLG